MPIFQVSAKHEGREEPYHSSVVVEADFVSEAREKGVVILRNQGSPIFAADLIHVSKIDGRLSEHVSKKGAEQ